MYFFNQIFIISLLHSSLKLHILFAKLRIGKDLPVSLQSDTLAIPLRGPLTLPPGKTLSLTKQTASTVVHAEGELLGRDHLVWTVAVGQVGVALARHAADGVARGGAEPEKRGLELKFMEVVYWSYNYSQISIIHVQWNLVSI